ncbi:class II fructose-1,6-bisphosphate aldolase [Thalassobacillus pellis]|uniref:class II fructose-1,6-bisphosphate aldolase n=1 Tax=Thalassobacillus pellis TaxID=748008 RepID=UPI001961093E|nr:class II fructose-1,6-bisphosphate aldolase [Thalassobacillus pellis]MBM7551576.1 fructose-bisphosphate aldolase class II/tagatose 1,6-diphosphate aldolase GatY/KbaY [Thalassobacillus pellis]
MAFVTSKEIMTDAYRNNYGIGAFAVHNLEILEAVVRQAEKLAAPIILQTTPGTVKYLGIDRAVQMIKATAEKAKIPIALHLDHGDSFETAMKCLRAGYTSIMIDGSHLPFEENIELVKRVVAAAKPMGVPVEAELGTIGGVEDDLEVSEEYAMFTQPSDAKTFVEETDIDFFAPAFGTAHGLYKKEPKLRFDLLEQINKMVDVPIVMHGASGVPDVSVMEALKYGVAKVNFSTELKVVFVEALRKVLSEDPDVSDPRKYFVPAMDEVSKVVAQKISLLGSANKGGSGLDHNRYLERSNR